MKDYRFGEVRAIPKDVEESRTIEFIISSEKRDRHKTVLKIGNWELENFNKNGIVGYQHNVWGGDLCSGPDPDDVIAEGKSWVEGNVLIGSARFEPAEINAKAEKIFRKVLHGTLKSTSVGFIETQKGAFGTGAEARGGENETYYYGRQELAEFSIVNIPSNTDAVKRHFRTTADNAILYLRRVLGDKYAIEEIENMSIKHVVQAVSGNFHQEKEEEEVKKELEEIEKEASTLKSWEQKLKINKNQIKIS